MEFSTTEDIDAPVEYVFARMSDFAAFERSAMRRGVEVARADTLAVPGPGMIWDTEFDLRGKRRELQLELTSYDPPNGMVLSSRSVSMGGAVIIDFVAMSRHRTRMSIAIDLQPKTLSARLLVQSLKLARGNLSKRFRNRVAKYTDDVEEKYRKSA